MNKQSLIGIAIGIAVTALAAFAVFVYIVFNFGITLIH